jgi:hypothetical protein
VITMEGGIIHLEVGHRALGALDPPCTFVEEE